MLISDLWTRNFLTVALVGLLVAPVWSADKRLLPADTEIVVTINVKQALDFRPAGSLRDALKTAGGALIQQATVNEYKKVIGQRLPGFDQIMKVLDKMDFDPLTDLHSLTVAQPRSIELSKLFVVVDGRFSADKLEAAVKKMGEELGQDLRVAKLDKAWLSEIKIKDAGGRVQSICFALVDDKTLVMSYQENAIKDALARIADNRFVAKRVEDLLKTTNNKQTLSFLLTRDAAVKLAREDKNNIEFLPLPSAIVQDEKLAKLFEQSRRAWIRWDLDIDGVSGALTLAQDLKFEFHFETKDKVRAQQWRATGDWVIGFLNDIANAHARQNPEWAFLPEITRAMRAGQTGRFADFTGTISYVNLAKLIVLLSPAE